MIPTNSSNWWKRIRKGDILETNHHVVLVYSVPDTSEVDMLLIMHACGILFSVDGDTVVEFTRKTLVSPFSIWMVSISNVTKGRIRLWR